MADTLIVEQQVRFRLTKNNQELYNQFFKTDADTTYTLHASDRLVLPAGMVAFQQASLGDIGASNPGTKLLVVSPDRAIDIAVNSTAQYVNGKVLMLAGASITALYFQNTDADNTATVEFVVVK